MKKKKIARQILSTALCVMMLSAYVPQMAFAEDGAGTGGTSYITDTETDTDTGVGAGLVTRTASGPAVSSGVASVTTANNETTSYTSFDDALAAAQAANGSTLKLLADYNGTVTVNSGSFTLDLNGHDITNESDSAIGVTAGATLTITDTVGGGCITSNSTSGVYNSGTMTIEGKAKVTNTSGAGVSNSGTLTICGDSYIAATGIGVDNSGTLTIEGNAKIESNWSVGIANTNGGKLSINGGSITSGGDCGVQANWQSTTIITGSPNIEGTDADFQCNGGAIDLSGVTVLPADGWTVYNSMSEDSLTIGTTGTLKINADHYAVDASGTEITELAADGQAIIQKRTDVAEVTIDGKPTTYTNIEAAWAAATATDVTEATLTLLADTAYSGDEAYRAFSVNAGQTLTLTGSHSLDLSSCTGIENNGTLNINSVSIIGGTNGVTNLGKLTITGGTITGELFGVSNNKDGTLTISGGAIVKGMGIYSNGVNNYGTLEISSGTITGIECGVSNIGNMTISDAAKVTSGAVGVENNGTLEISGGTITSDDIGVNNNSSGEVTISGGSISGSVVGVTNSSGKMTITGTATVQGNEWGISNYDELEISGGSITGGSIGVDNMGGTVNISGAAKVTGTTAYGVNNAGSGFENEETTSGTMTISGGTITGGYTGVFNYSKLEISGGAITGNDTGVDNHGTLTITGEPVIEGTGVDFIYNSGTIDLGGVTEGAADGWTVYNWNETAMTIGTAGRNLITPVGYEVQVFCQAVESLDGESTGIVAKTDTHSGEHVYSAEGNKITESCSGSQAVLGSAVITAEGGIYNGSAYEAVVTNEGTFTDKSWNIIYQKDSEVLTGAPVDAGTYTASISLGEGATASVDFTIEKKTLTVTGATADTKTYDGSAAVTVTGVTLAGIISGDDVSVVVTGLTGTVDSANAGTYTKVTLPALSLTGEQAENYTLTQPEGAVAANVTINKAAVAPKLPEGTMNVSYEMETVGEVTLPAGWAWAEADAAKALVVDTAVTATAVYTGTDKGNYETETVSVAITRSTCSHTGGTATCTEKAVCAVCREAYGIVDSSNHGETETRNAVSATCTETGYTGDTYCKDCGVKAGSGTTIAKTSHRDGNNDGACDACGYEMPAPTPVVTPGATVVPEATPVVTPGATVVPEATPVVTPGPTDAPEATPAPTYHPEKSWITEEISKAYEEAAKQYDVLLGTSAKDASMVKTMQVGGTIDLNYYGVQNWKSSDYEWNWTSSDESVATVNDMGVVTMLSEGIVIIRLELVHKPTGEQLSVAPVLIGVPEADYDIFLGTSAKDASMMKTMQVGKTIDLNYYGVKNWKKDDYECEWSSTDEEIATVSEVGLVTAKAPGQVIIRLKLKRKATREYLVVAPVVLTVPEKTEE